ncbi:MAG: hypothetical protein NTV07_06015, partial [Candidatus Omnitrophica bacterium]|nr:hypothetical protein [Candidatus Omnitrophota bacterium]
CVSSGQEPAAAEVIRKACADKKCRLYEVGRDIHFREERFDGSSSRQQAFSVSGISGKYPFLKIGLLGDHQLMNAATAIGLVESLRFYDIIVSYNSIRDGLKKVNWPGRLQVLKEAPLVVLDGAQNRASAAALSKAVKRFFKYDRLILVLGISKDKDIKGVCEELQDISSEIILTRADIPRAAEPGIIKNYFNKPARLTGRVEEALGLAQEMAGPTDLILITGSFFVLGEAVAKAKMPELNYA